MKHSRPPAGRAARLTLFCLLLVSLCAPLALNKAAGAPRPGGGIVRARSADASQQQAPAGSQAQERREAELVTLRPAGFEPREITRPAGRFLLAVDNLSGVDALSLQLNAEVGGRLLDVSLLRGRAKYRGELNPPPGRYTLTVEGHPDWVLHLTVTPGQ